MADSVQESRSGQPVCQGPVKRDLEEESEAQSDEEFWKTYVQSMYPELLQRSYFVPEVHINKTKHEPVKVDGKHVEMAGEKVLGKCQPLNSSDLRCDKAIERVLHCLRLGLRSEVMFVLHDFEFRNYLNNKSFEEACKRLPRPGPSDWGDFDFLILHRRYGILAGEVKAIASKEDKASHVVGKVREAIKQLQKAKRVLEENILTPPDPPRVKTAVIMPNVYKTFLREALSQDANSEVNEQLKDCLGAGDADPVDLCLCADDLSSPQSPWDVNNEVLKSFQDWWQNRMIKGGEDDAMTDNAYLTLVARFCGPASTVAMACIDKPRVSLKTLGDAVTATGMVYERLTLYPEQLTIYKDTSPRVFLTGPPGTGKTVLLQLTARRWLTQGKPVHVVSTWNRSRLICKKLGRLLKEKGSDIVHHHFYEFGSDVDSLKDVDAAVSELTQTALKNPEGDLFVIADESGPTGYVFGEFCQRLHAKVPGLCLWAANCLENLAPPNWKIEVLKKLLRSPPAVKREVEVAEEFQEGEVQNYDDEHLFPHPTDGVGVKTFCHSGEHEEEDLDDCVQCGETVAKFLIEDLRVGQNDAPSRTPGRSSKAKVQAFQVRYKDVVVLYGDQPPRGLLTAFQNWGIPAKVATLETDTHESEIPANDPPPETDEDNLVGGREDLVWVVDGDRTYGLEWRVVICVGGHEARDEDGRPVGLSLHDRLHRASRSTSQLVFLVP